MKRLLYTSCLSLAVVLLLAGCKRNYIQEVTPPSQQKINTATFAGDYFVVNNPATEFKIPVGITAVSNVDRTIQFSYTSSTGAASGAQYTAPASITIPAGKTFDTLRIKGIFAGLAGGRKDVLKIRLSGGDQPNFVGKDSFVLTLQQFCALDMSVFNGDFVVVRDDWNDYLPGDVVPLTSSGNTITFYYPTDIDPKPLLIQVDPTTFATSVAPTDFGGYTIYGPEIYSAKSVAGPTSRVVPCDKSVSVNLNIYSGPDDFGNNVLILRKK
jgi:hypothetical protein